MIRIRLDDKKIKWDDKGAFPCPKCGNILSPDDSSDESYKVLESVVKNKKLTGLIIKCLKCKTKIELITP